MSIETFAEIDPVLFFWATARGRFIREGDDDVVYELAPGTPAPSRVRTIRGVKATGTRVP